MTRGEMVNASAASAAGELLALWEQAASVAVFDRDDALLSAMYEVLPASLGARNAALLSLRSHLFGQTQQLRCNCPHCDAASEFAIDCDALSQALLPADEALQPQQLEAEGYCVEFRLPDATDLREAASRTNDDTHFVQALLQRCITRCVLDDGSACTPEELPGIVTEALSRRMEELEPGAGVSFDLTCPECSKTWSAPMNVGDVLWSELQLRAERLLLDVDALARAYGWSEAQVLALSPMRRAAYLQLVGAG